MNIFRNVAQPAGGGCCKVGGLYVMTEEYKRIPEEYRRGFKKHYSGYVSYSGKPCPFINEKGCILGENRFFECKLYPLEVSGIDKLVLKKECPHNKHFDNEAFLAKGYELFEKYKQAGWLDEKDVVGILNNEFWRVAEKEIV